MGIYKIRSVSADDCALSSTECKQGFLSLQCRCCSIMQHFTGGALHVRAMQSSSRRELYWLTGVLLHAKTLRASAQLRVTSPPSQWCEPSLSLHSGLSLCGAVVVSGPRSRHRVCSSITGSFRVRVTVKMESPPSAFLAANRRSDSFHICTECGGGLAYSCDCPSLKLFSMKHFN